MTTGADATPPIAFFISDIDGTLVTADKVLTPASVEAARKLARAGVAFTVISSRPPRGMARVVQALGIHLPFAAYNGAVLAGPDGRVIAEHPLEPSFARRTLELLEAGGVDAWVFAGDDWLLRDVAAANVARERKTVGFDPIVVDNFDAVAGAIGKIVGVSDDHSRLDACEAKLRAVFGDAVAVNRSQPYYLDIADRAATKGQAVGVLCNLIGVPPIRTAVMGDMFNDVSMFAVAGLAVAMGQAPQAVKDRADFVTASNAEEGFASGVERFILPRAAEAAA